MVNVAPMRQFDFGRPMAGSKASAPGELVQRLCAPAVPERAEGGDRRAGRLRSRLRVATARALDLRLYVVEVEQPPPQPEWRIGVLTDARQLVGPLT